MNSKFILGTTKRVLNEYYPEYRKEAPLPPELLELCVEFLIEKKTGYYDNGQLSYQETYVNGELHGECKYWYPSDEVGGSKASENGRLMVQGTYVNGKKHGEWKEWYKNGQLKSQVTYVNGELHGEWKGWWDDGQLKFQGTYVNGEKHGDFKWYIYGYLISQETWVNGQESNNNICTVL